MPKPHMVSVTDLTDLESLDAEEVGSWTARCNIVAQETFLSSIVSSIGDRYDHVAGQLGISVADLHDVLSGRVDLNMSEIRLLGIAAECVVSYSVLPARPQYSRWLTSARNWARDAPIRGGHHQTPDLDPADYGRRALEAI
ncbi:MAG: hypothetical protein FJW64_10300 [Actinobacteria bacterium]|nr:hypothetical protein [Actinomycetota bacterium]